MARTIYADADYGRERPARRAFALDQDAREFRAVADHVVGPFEPDARGEHRGQLADRIMERERRHERELGSAIGGTRVGEEQAGVEIAALGNEGAAAPSAARRLLRRRDPQRAALAQPRLRQRLGIRRSDGVVDDQPNPGGGGSGIELHAGQNSDFAAASAASMSGAG